MNTRPCIFYKCMRVYQGCDIKDSVWFLADENYGYFQIARRRTAHIQKYPDAKVISLGIGDTTEPIPQVITGAMEEVCGAVTYFVIFWVKLLATLSWLLKFYLHKYLLVFNLTNFESMV